MQIKERPRKESPYKIIPGKNGTSAITLYHKDCIQGMKELIPEKSVGAIVTSPPYNIGVHYSSHRDNLPRQKYLEWMGELGLAVKRVLRDDGSFFLNIGDTPKDQ
ncbi:MAG TPA: DNA methyltransferase, partial [Nitrososphaerales archaeon]|nr:DNA methyltransferase [Nitrososphaerales archaeon]